MAIQEIELKWKLTLVLLGLGKLYKNLTFRAITEDSNRTIALETGEIDIAYDIQGLDKDRLKGTENIKFIEEPSLGMGYLGFNTKKKPFINPKE